MESTVRELDPVVLGLISMAIPLICSVINQWGWTSQTKALVGAGVAVAFGIFAAWYQDLWNREGVLVCILAVWGFAQALEARFFKPLGVSAAVENNIMNLHTDAVIGKE